MKTSIHKALVLSFALLVIGGSGCERRGRAPVSNAPANPSSPTTTTNTAANDAPTSPKSPTTVQTSLTPPAPITAPTAPTTLSPMTPPIPQTPPAPLVPTGPEILPTEAQYETDANMNCKVPAIVDGKISADEFVKDLKTMNDYLACMGASGLVLTCSDGAGHKCETVPEEKRVWVLDADPKNSKAADEFARISKEKDDGVAFKTMNARLELSILRLGKMGTKYNADALKANNVDGDSPIKFDQSDLTINATLSSFAKAKKALEDQRANIQAMKTVDDGVDSQDASTLKTMSNKQTN